jgi:cytochrome c553
MTNILLKSIAAAGLAGILSGSALGADIEHGKELATKKYVCTSCHGADFKTPIDPSYPKLAGQYGDYLEHALLTYKHGSNPMMGRNNAIMDSQAMPLSDSDVADIAAYLASLPGPLVQRK